MPITKDIWRPLIVEAPIDVVLRAGTIEGFGRHWLPEEGFLRFLADPFGMERGGRRFIFVERYDYRTRRGVIDCLAYEGTALIERREVLAEPWHLSYPFVGEADGEVWMLPEAHKSGGLTLYRAAEFPWRWERSYALMLDHVAVDATPVFHNGLWWLFYAAADDARTKTAALFAAWAERLTGPWTPHASNPVRLGADSTRPGGTPAVVDGILILPVQDCRQTYGGAIRPLSIHRLDPERFEADAGAAITAPAAFAPFDAGLHTLSAMGNSTLVDVKQRLLSPRSLAVLAKRELIRR